MRKQEEKLATATQFLDLAEQCLVETEKNFNLNIKISIPLSEEDFYKVYESLETVRELGRKRNIQVEVADLNDSLKEYSHAYTFYVKRIVA